MLVYQRVTFSKTAPCKVFICLAHFAGSTKRNALKIVHLLAPFRMGIEEGMGVKIQREVSLVIPQLQRPWRSPLHNEKARLFLGAKTGESSNNCYEAIDRRPVIPLVFELDLGVSMGHQIPGACCQLFSCSLRKLPISHFQTHPSAPARGKLLQCLTDRVKDTFQYVHDPLTPQQKG